MKERGKPGARRALALLLALNILCYLDRYILAAVEPEIRRTFFAPEDPNAMAKTGALATAFLVSYMVLSPLFGWLADKHSRWAIIATGAGIPVLLAAATLTGTVVRRMTGATSTTVFLFGFMACLFLAPVALASEPFFASWASGMLFGITVYGLAVPAVLLVLMQVATFYHSALGLQVVIEDYVENEALKFGLLIVMKLVSIVLAALGIFAVLKLSFAS